MLNYSVIYEEDFQNILPTLMDFYNASVSFFFKKTGKQNHWGKKWQTADPSDKFWDIIKVSELRDGELETPGEQREEERKGERQMHKEENWEKKEIGISFQDRVMGLMWFHIYYMKIA